MPKLTREQRDEIVTIASLHHTNHPAYPLEYVAALYGVSRARVSILLSAAGKFRRGHFSRSCAGTGFDGRNLRNLVRKPDAKFDSRAL